MLLIQVSYAIILVPISIARISSFNGTNVPFWATAFTDVIFNLTGMITFNNIFSSFLILDLTGFVNSVLVVYFEKSFASPGTSFAPVFSLKRQTFRRSFVKSGGIIPFTAQESNSDEKPPPVPPIPQQFIVDLPGKPRNTYVPPESWKTTASAGQIY